MIATLLYLYTMDYITVCELCLIIYIYYLLTYLFYICGTTQQTIAQKWGHDDDAIFLTFVLICSIYMINNNNMCFRAGEIF